MCRSTLCPTRDEKPNPAKHLKSVEQVNAIRASRKYPPLTPEEIMPDGFHAKTFKSQKIAFEKRFTQAHAAETEARKELKRVWGRYEELFPDKANRPSFIRWFVNQSEVERALAERQFLIATLSQKNHESTKATNTLLQEKEKLKQSIEVETVEVDPTKHDEVFQQIADFLKIPHATLKQLIDANESTDARN